MKGIKIADIANKIIESFEMEKKMREIKKGEIPDNISFNNIKSFYMVESAIKSSKEKKMINNEGEHAN